MRGGYPSGIHNRLPHIVEGLWEFEVNNFLSYHCRTETYLRNRRISAGSFWETAEQNNPPGEVCTYLDGKLRDLSQKLRHGLNQSDLFFLDTK